MIRTLAALALVASVTPAAARCTAFDYAGCTPTVEQARAYRRERQFDRSIDQEEEQDTVLGHAFDGVDPDRLGYRGSPLGNLAGVKP